MDLQNLWFVLIAVLWARLLRARGLRLRRRHAAAVPAARRARARRDVRVDRPGLGRQRGLARHRGRRDVRGLPGLVRDDVLGLLHRAAARPRLPDHPRVSFEWRDEEREPGAGGASGLWANAIGSFGAALIWGIGLSNLLYGVPIDSSGDFAGGFWDLFNGYTVLGGIAVVLLFAFHGATFLTLRTTGDLCERAGRGRPAARDPAAAVGGAFLVWTVAVAVDRNDKNVFPPLLPPRSRIAALVARRRLRLRRRRNGWAFALTAVGAIALRRDALHEPLPARDGLEHRLRQQPHRRATPPRRTTRSGDDASSPLIFVPLVLLYQGWTYHVFRARVGGEASSERRHPALGRRAGGPRQLAAMAALDRASCAARGRSASCSPPTPSSASSPRCSSSRRRSCSRGSPRARSTARRSRDVAGPLALLAAVVCARAAAAWGFEVVGRRAAAQRALAAAPRPRRAQAPTASPPRSTAPRAPRSRRSPSPASTRSRRPSPATCRRSCSPCVVPIAVLALVAVDRPHLGGVMLLTLPLVPVFMWLIGRYTEQPDARALAGALAARHPLPRRRARAADAARLQPRRRRRPSRSTRSATGTGARRWARCASPSSPARCSSSRRRSASRSSRSRSACGSSTAASASRRR